MVPTGTARDKCRNSGDPLLNSNSKTASQAGIAEMIAYQVTLHSRLLRFLTIKGIFTINFQTIRIIELETFSRSNFISHYSSLLKFIFNK
jgi:hypothetical protein